MPNLKENDKTKRLIYKKLPKEELKEKISGKVLRKDRTILYKVTSIIVEPHEGRSILMVMKDSSEDQKGSAFDSKGYNLFYLVLSTSLTHYFYRPKSGYDFIRRQFGVHYREGCLKHAIKYYIKRLKQYAKDVKIKFTKEEYKEIRSFLRSSVMELIDSG